VGHRRVLIDSSVWIYHLSSMLNLAVAAGAGRRGLWKRVPFRGVASELTLLELTVALQLGRQDVADEYELLLSYFQT